MDPYEEKKEHTKRYKKIKKILKSTFGYDDFRPRQYETINKILSGKDVCAIFPTGYGKSLCYQLPALYKKEPAIIISPLISLMNDQQIILEKLGLTSCCFNSNVSDKKEMRKNILEGEYQFIYITPESASDMGEFFQKLEEKQGISLVAIDEAHCISSYGHDFRKSYRNLTFLKQFLPNVPILAVTATATTDVGRDICTVLGLTTRKPMKTSFDRPNLYIEVNKKSKIEKDIIPIIKKYLDKAIIIYCISIKETDKIANALTNLGYKCGRYHSGVDPDDKEKTHRQFLKGKINIVAATIAFGMGINKADVRVVIHYGAPKNIEGYYQEIGRAGRDGKKSYCFVFYNNRDFVIQKYFINNCKNREYQIVQMSMLEQMREFVETEKCRRKILLEYFDEDASSKCNFCDNCCGCKKISKKDIAQKNDQNVNKEAKIIIDLIESINDRNFGVTMLINILRGSNNKSISAAIKKNKYYGKGKHKSVEWWKELIDNLIKIGFLHQVSLKSGRFPMQVIKVKKQGLDWASISELDGFLGGLGVPELGMIKMSNAI